MRSGPGVCSRPLSAIARSSTRSATRPRSRRPSPSTTSPTAPRPMPPPPPTDRRTRAMADLAQIPTTVVGSHGKPGWWFASVKAHEAGEFGPADLEEAMDDAADTAIRDMERAGIDIITDGEVRRLDGYVDSYYRIIKNIRPTDSSRKLGPWGYDQQTRYVAVGRIGVPEAGLGIVDEF